MWKRTGVSKVSLDGNLSDVRLLTFSATALCDSIKADHGYNMDSKSVRNLLQVMSELDLPQRKDFLQFVTGSPKLPIGGKHAALIHLKKHVRLTDSNRFQEPQPHVDSRLSAE